MKQIFILLALVITSQMSAQDFTKDVVCNNISFNKIHITLSNGDLNRAPYHGAPVTSSYSPELKTLTVWFHYNMEDAEIIITKNGEEVSDNVFCMNANDAVEYDLSECGEGEYAVYVQINGELQMTNIFLKGN